MRAYLRDKQVKQIQLRLSKSDRHKWVKVFGVRATQEVRGKSRLIYILISRLKLPEKAPSDSPPPLLIVFWHTFNTLRAIYREGACPTPKYPSYLVFAYAENNTVPLTIFASRENAAVAIFPHCNYSHIRRIGAVSVNGSYRAAPARTSEADRSPFFHVPVGLMGQEGT